MSIFVKIPHISLILGFNDLVYVHSYSVFMQCIIDWGLHYTNYTCVPALYSLLSLWKCITAMTIFNGTILNLWFCQTINVHCAVCPTVFKSWDLHVQLILFNLQVMFFCSDFLSGWKILVSPSIHILTKHKIWLPQVTFPLSN